MNKSLLTLFLSCLIWLSCSQPTLPPPAAVEPIPSARQLAWQELEYYGFIHFNMNTFSNMEWGMGDEDPALFNPTELDCRQWARVCKEAGMKGIILTAKHHDGFCLWPSAYTEHSVKNSPWKNGEGDVLRELSEACKEYGLKFGVYLSPWDRNHADYGKPEYLSDFRNQLRELLTNYGDVFEVWFDGANGGTGYYGGANEERKVDKLTYYDWENTISIIRELQPNAVVFSDAGPDVRWVGNEHGYAYPTTWSPLVRDSVYGGMPEYAKQYSAGQSYGTHWVPAEADVSIRPGWYYHPYEDHKVKSLPELLEIYYRSVGRNASLLLNFPVDQRGLIHEADVAQLQKLTAKIQEDFALDLAEGKTATASEERGSGYEASQSVDGNPATYWATPDGVIQSSLRIDLGEKTSFNRLLMQEYIALGQRVEAFTVEAKTESGWEEIASETTIGYQRILRFPTVEASEIRLSITAAKACPTLSRLSVFLAPPLLLPPTIARNQAGEVRIEGAEEGQNLYYTLDGSLPTAESARYEQPFFLPNPTRVQAIAVEESKDSEPALVDFGVSAAKWRVLSAGESLAKAFDGDPSSWGTASGPAGKQDLLIDLGETLPLRACTYLPMQARWISGFIQTYSLSLSTDNRNWTEVSRGEFGNILNSPILQRIEFPRTEARYLRLRALSTVDGEAAAFAEVGVVTQP